MLNYLDVKHDKDKLKEVEALYNASFPLNERIDFKYLTNDDGRENDLLAFYDNDIFIGFVNIMGIKDVVDILYLAVVEKYQGQGYGSQILDIVSKLKTPRCIMVDIEKPNSKLPNYVQRIKRKEFYKNNGYIDNNIVREWEGETYEVLSLNKIIEPGDYERFWQEYFK